MKPTCQRKPNSLVLGGGVAGLAAGYFAKVPVYEAAPFVGGVAASKTVDGFCFDHGIHVMQTEQQSMLELFDRWNIGFHHRRRHALIYSHGAYTPYPFQINTAGLPLRLRLRCVWHYLCRDVKSKPADYREWINQNVGRGFADTFLIPYSQKFWTIDPADMTCDWTSNRVPQTNLWAVLRGAVVSSQTDAGSNASFRYPNHGVGYGAIPDRMGACVSEVRTSHRATCIDVERRTVEFNDGQSQVDYETIISTIPLPELIRIIPQAPDDVRRAAHDLKCNSIMVVNLGVDRDHISESHWIHYPEPGVSFFRISFPQNLGDGLVPAGKSAVSAEVAYTAWAPIDKSTIVERVIDDLIRTGVLKSSDRIIVRDTMDISYAYPIYDKPRRGNVRRIHEWLESNGILSAGRYGLWAYLWSHEAIQSGKQVGLKVANLEDAEAQFEPMSA